MKNLSTLFAALGLVCAFGCAPEAPAPAPAPAPTHEEHKADEHAAPAATETPAPAETPAAAPEGGSTAN